MPLTFLFAYLVARKFAVRRMFRWTGPAMLLGVWLTGGVFMTLAAVVSGSGFLGSGVGLIDRNHIVSDPRRHVHIGGTRW